MGAECSLVDDGGLATARERTITYVRRTYVIRSVTERAVARLTDVVKRTNAEYAVALQEIQTGY
jgi:hypothetical protein